MSDKEIFQKEMLDGLLRDVKVCMRIFNSINIEVSCLKIKIENLENRLKLLKEPSSQDNLTNPHQEKK